MPKVVVEQTGKGIKLAKLVAAAMFFGGIYQAFQASKAKDQQAVMLWTVVIVLGVVISVLASFVRWWRHE